MAKDSLTQIVLLLDRSGSMADVRQATIDGVNEFIDGQKLVPGEANFTFIQFDSNDPYEVVFDKQLKDAPKVSLESFVPRGSTPLHDALGQTIVELGTRLKNTEESKRPSKVIVVIMTDGLENASRKFSAPKIAEMVKHQQDVYKWQFIYLGANQDAIMTGEKLNFAASQCMSFSVADPLAVGSIMSSTTSNVSTYRNTGVVDSLKYTSAQRKAAMGTEKKN